MTEFLRNDTKTTTEKKCLLTKQVTHSNLISVEKVHIDFPLFRVVEIHRIDEATATPQDAEGAHLSEQLSNNKRI